MIGNAQYWARYAMPEATNGFTLRARVADWLFPMFRIESWLKRLCAVGLILLLQGPAMLVQEVAWAKMLVSYTQQRGLLRGVVDTFDGKHPCKMCAQAEAIRKSEGKGDPQHPQSGKKSIRFTWGEMVTANRLVVPEDRGRDCLKPLATASTRTPGRGKDSPVLPPPEQA
jgi:hypothetical protein